MNLNRHIDKIRKLSVDYNNKNILITICKPLLFSSTESCYFNIYTQQGGTATIGAGQINQRSGMTIYCIVNNAKIITENSAIG